MSPKTVNQDWKKLEPGDAVVVIDADSNESPGIVDCKTTRSDVIWVVDHKGRGRRAFDHREGIKVVRS
ncbi:hypothetical protein NtRootA9_01080 [Arthrobacter sp. NtRootA9]|nr:hypothetical protein NtRootA9_01080 [Arthrobacter sp. NtRootA9]